jgi:dolichol-phosphate mannosyltransferase
MSESEGAEGPDADVCVLVPTKDEEGTIGDVVRGFRERGFSNVLVIDGKSTDRTVETAREAGARVVTQSGGGKGAAVREAVREHTDAEYVLLLDGDATYDAADAEAMLEPLVDGEADHVIGNRFADLREGAMPRMNQLGNRAFNRAFAAVHGEDLRDILSGYRAFSRRSFLRMDLTAEGFGIETEMAVECVKANFAVEVVPITYRPRPEGSQTNLHPLKDGGVILMTIYRMAKTSNPLFYFGSVGFLSLLCGVGLGAYVGVEWVTQRISHEVMAVVAGVAILVGIQLLMFGLLSDMFVSLHREQMRRIEELEDR